MIKLMVFDMAGTTIHDEGTVNDCFLRALAQAGIQATGAEISLRMGLSKLEVFDELARREESDPSKARGLRELAFTHFLQEIEGQYLSQVRPIAGAEETFRILRDQGIALALNTGFDWTVARRIVVRLGWQQKIDALVTSDEVRRGRPAPDMIRLAMLRCRVSHASKVAVIGDTTADILAGQSADVSACFGVLTGTHDVETLRRSKPTAILASVADLPGMLHGCVWPDQREGIPRAMHD